MNLSVSPIAAQIAAVLSHPSARAALVTLGEDGHLEATPVAYGKSVLNLRTELRDHLESAPYTAEFLADLRDYLDARLIAIDEARRTNGFVVAREPGRWEIAHVPAFRPVAEAV